MRIARDIRRWMITLLAAGIGITFPAIAQAGFFDFLFSQPSVPAAQPYLGEPDHMDFRRRPGHGFHDHKLAARRKHFAAAKEDHPSRPGAPTDIMDDESLRRGDAVMTQAGIRIFVGYSSDHHQPEDFRRISEIKKLSQRERNSLAALDAPGGNSGGQVSGTPASREFGLITGRSATEHKVSVGEIITDPLGRTLRYVGP